MSLINFPRDSNMESCLFKMNVWVQLLAIDCVWILFSGVWKYQNTKYSCIINQWVHCFAFLLIYIGFFLSCLIGKHHEQCKFFCWKHVCWGGGVHFIWKIHHHWDLKRTYIPNFSQLIFSNKYASGAYCVEWHKLNVISWLLSCF